VHSVVRLAKIIDSAIIATQEGCAELDKLSREIMTLANQERDILAEEDVASQLAIVASLRTNENPGPRNGQGKPRKQQKPQVESDVLDSPGPSPGEARSEMIKRVKGTSQRSSSTASQSRAMSTSKEDANEMNQGVRAEKRGDLKVDADVFYKIPDVKVQNASKDHQKIRDMGVGTHMVIKKVLQDKRP
jgi:hypothetical protein